MLELQKQYMSFIMNGQFSTKQVIYNVMDVQLRSH